ncbi:L-histidine N(alpha)-methyltransferase [Hymenobacter busanensis]|uniref:L-histidine N(Alpha)-methyltransferase n=1 Tax=Hymenobacter busanensis TaxID=2607656 RepID=A0A7L4ZRQ1_9BACT|nr:L-histidine N(alpha)-methyltransferase [Hymenobacter busanensis]KAA9327129.1 L-histidine N(alpha)-methyltransferase [Hymenobacter busanensis]QHJ05794.1 L-histidine N(alpha)-methyltransferase [Hymenobacter busanensis]
MPSSPAISPTFAALPTSPATTPDTQALQEHVRSGLTRTPKTLSSMYFYDEVGSRLFQQIMQLPEYYPTRTEFGLMTEHRHAIAAALMPANGVPLHLLELGAGDGLKTKILLRELLSQQANFTYAPVDISPSALDELRQSLEQELPELRVQPLTAEYTAALPTLREQPGRKAVLFLGSNIGNFLPADRLQFLRQLAQPLAPDDRLFVGFDLRKDPRVIQAAYDDAQGVTAAFNLNLLHRLNRELGADFQVDQWQHFAQYNPLDGAMRSFLVSRRAQQVHVAALGQSFAFEAWEAIHTENSYKFTLPQIEALAAEAGLQVLEVFTDEQAWFADVLLAPVGK